MNVSTGPPESAPTELLVCSIRMCPAGPMEAQTPSPCFCLSFLLPLPCPSASSPLRLSVLDSAPACLWNPLHLRVWQGGQEEGTPPVWAPFLASPPLPAAGLRWGFPDSLATHNARLNREVVSTGHRRYPFESQ